MQLRSRVKELLRDYIESLLLAVVFALIIRALVLSAYKIQTPSMSPSLQIGDFVFAYKVPYGLRLPLVTKKLLSGAIPKRGEIVLFHHPQDDDILYIKRVIALAGDKVEIKKRRLYINDTPAIYAHEDSGALAEDLSQDTNQLDSRQELRVLRENILGTSHLVSIQATEENFGPVVVPVGQFFVLGDNRGPIDDSRAWGSVPLENIDGRVFTIWLSLDWQHEVAGFPALRFNRLFHSL